jgi:hypothetical protein
MVRRDNGDASGKSCRDAHPERRKEPTAKSGTEGVVDRTVTPIADFIGWGSSFENHPVIVEVLVGDDLVIGDLVFARLEPLASGDPAQTTDRPFCVVYELLTPGTAFRLETALRTIRALHDLHIDNKNALALLVQLFLLEIDASWGRQRHPRLLERMKAERSPSAGSRQTELQRTPCTNLDTVLEFWDLLGGRYASQIAMAFRDGVPCYLAIPSAYASRADIQRLLGADSEDDRALATFLGRLLPVRPDAPEKMPLDRLHDEFAAPVREFDGMGRNIWWRDDKAKKWKIRFRGGQIVEMDHLAGIHYLAVLLDDPGKHHTPTDLVQQTGRYCAHDDDTKRWKSEAGKQDGVETREEGSRSASKRSFLSDPACSDGTGRLRSEYMDVQDRIKDMHNNNENIPDELIQREEQLLSKLKKSTMASRKIAGSTGEKHRTSVYKAIDTAYRKLKRNGLAELESFLRSNVIHPYQNWTYLNLGGEDWDVKR